MSPTNLISLEVNADNPFAEIFVVDGAYQLVARGIAQVKAELVPGVFKIKVRVGRYESEEIRLVETDTVINVTAPQQDSPIPIAGTAMTHEYQMSAAETYAKSTQVTAGTGAGIFSMACTWSSASPSPAQSAPGSNPADGVALLDGKGNVVADFGKSSVVNDSPGTDPWAACSVAVDPGYYVLRTALSEGIVVEQTVFAPAGWQVQLFLLSLTPGGGTIDLSSLGNMAVSIAKLGAGFSGTDDVLRQTDLVRIALADGRAVFSNAVLSLIDGMIHKKFENPILGIYGAHLMLMGREYFARPHDNFGQSLDPGFYEWIFSDGIFDEIITNLRLLVGNDHADVEALSLKCGNADLRATAPAAVPPMLRRSWSLLVEASNDDPQIVSLGLWERIAAMVPAGPFLCWNPDPETRGAGAAANPSASLWQRTGNAIALLAVPLLGAAGGVFAVRGGSSAARRRHTSPALRAVDAALPAQLRESFRSDADRSRLAMELDVPRVAIDSVLGRRSTTPEVTVDAGNDRREPPALSV